MKHWNITKGPYKTSGTTETPVHFISFLGWLSSRDFSFLFISSCKIAFFLGGATQYQHFTTSKCTHPKWLKKFVQPKRGFRKKVVVDLTKLTSGFNGADPFVALLSDEMKIKENVILDKHAGSLTGFIDLGDTDINTVSFDKKENLATHALV